MKSRSHLLLASTMLVGLTAIAAGAHAQDKKTCDAILADASASAQAKADCQKPAADEGTTVVVTGSRIRNKEFTSASPVQIITAERSVLLGQTDTTKILQGTTTANTAPQINNEYTGFVTTGGPGTNTLSLRGLGPQRTLILLNGHRVGPAGVRGQVGPADLNTIPSSIIDRTEILKDGASSIYGSDAVAGVVNIITKKNYTGGDFVVSTSLPQEKGGEQYSVSFSQGFLKDRWHGGLSYSYYEQAELTQADRKFMTCPVDYVFNPTTGDRIDILDTTPGGTGTARCNILLNGRVDNLTTGRSYVYDSSAVNGGGPKGDYLNGLRRVGVTYAGDLAASYYSQGQNPVNDPKFLNRTIISPVRRQALNLFGGYDLNDTTEIYTEVMVNSRHSDQRSWRQLFPQVDYRNPNNPFRTGNPAGLAGPAYARSIISLPSIADQSVDYSRYGVGIKGDMPSWGSLKNWTYDIFVQESDSRAEYGGNFIYNDRVLATTGILACDTTVLTTATTCPTGGVNYFRPSTVATGEFTPEEKAFLYSYEFGSTKYTQTYISGDFSGDLFTIPAGTVAGAFGFMLRREAINDNPGPQAKANNYWGSTTAGQTVGSDSISEAYVDLAVPLLKNVFLAKKLDLEMSGRYSDYKSYGGSSTYKVSLNWAINNVWRLRASQGTSFRAPALYELYLANQSGFLGQSSIDPCYNLGATAGASATVVTNCAAQGIPTNYTAAGFGSALVTTGGGKGILEAETSTSKTFGIVYTPSWSNLFVDIDYYETSIQNQVGNYGAANILYACYNSPNLSSPFCSLFNRDLGASSPTKFMITSVKNNYVNIAGQYVRGVDLTVSYGHDFKWAKFLFDSHNTFTTRFTQTAFPGSVPQQYNGFVGFPNYTGDMNFNFRRNDWTLNWNINFVGRASDLWYYGTDRSTYLGQTSYLKRYAEFTSYHTVSLRKVFDKWAVVGTVSNLFDEQPPAVSTGALAAVSRLGTAPLTSQYDLFGRTFGVRVQRKW